MITPYTIAIPQADLDDLKSRLARVRWSNELPGVGISYGVPLEPIKRLAKYWLEDYDWRIWEAKLNAYPQFTTTIDGQNIYFLHIRSQEDDALPLILTHGWPSSVIDYLDLIWRILFRWHIRPSQATGDMMSGTIEIIKALEDAHIRADIPIAERGQRSGYYGSAQFTYDAVHDQFSCPASGKSCGLRTAWRGRRRCNIARTPPLVTPAR